MRWTSMLGTAAEAAKAGEQLSVDLVTELLAFRGEPLRELMRVAASLRDEGLRHAGRPGVITYSRKVFIPLTTLCRDRCHYCVFVDTPGQLERKGATMFMEPDRVVAVARQGAALGCKEALLTLGDRPEDRWPEARTWLDEHGFASTIDYVAAMAQLILDETGLLPHANPGVMLPHELELLRPLAPSMGMMLETTSRRLFEERGEVHYGSPDKDPATRLRVIDDAGRLRIPFTTGVLMGIGETLRERAESLIALREASDRHGHVQEVIVQNFRAKPSTAMRNDLDFEGEEYLAAIASARLVMGADARIQVPPNLSDAGELAQLLGAGVDDWGGVSPLTADHVNPERPWPQITELARLTAAAGFELRERLTAHPRYLREAAEWIDPALHSAVAALADADTMLAADVRPVGRAEGAAVGAAGGGPRLLPVRTVSAADGLLRTALRVAADDPTALDDEQAAALLGASGTALDELTVIADHWRRDTVGESISLVVNRNVSSNLLGTAVLPGLDTVSDIAADAWSLGATELCVQGVVPADQPADSYLLLARAVRDAAAGIHLHAFRPADLDDGARRLGWHLDDYLVALRDAGVSTVPGTGVKLLDEQLRQRVAPGDLPVQRWVEVIRAAHGAGLRSTAIMVYGFGEQASTRVSHLRQLVRLQSETAGFSEFVPMPAPGAISPIVRGRSELDEHRAVHAVSRLLLHGRIPHLQAPWARLGRTAATAMLRSGADDLGGTLLDGRVAPDAGVEVGNELRTTDAAAITRRLGRPLRLRTTLYGESPDERAAAARAAEHETAA